MNIHLFQFSSSFNSFSYSICFYAFLNFLYKLNRNFIYNIIFKTNYYTIPRPKIAINAHPIESL